MTRDHEVTDEMLMALADAELPEPEARRLRERIAGRPDLAARYAEFVETRQLLHAAFPVSPVPDRLIAAVLDQPAAAPRPSSVARQRRLSGAAGAGLALAASIVLAVGGFWTGRSTAPGLATPGPEAVAQALAGTPTGSVAHLPDGSTARVLASFETEFGLCRLIGHDSQRHIACRASAGDGWVVAMSVHSGEDGGFLPASDLAVGLIDRLLDEIGAGPALSPQQEAAALR